MMKQNKEKWFDGIQIEGLGVGARYKTWVLLSKSDKKALDDLEKE